jgi:hypothetical protein
MHLKKRLKLGWRVNQKVLEKVLEKTAIFVYYIPAKPL